ncbi:MAG: ubiquitin-conjugating enzyme E2 variant [Promethearchaeota archaeon]|jgi:ubiquitin-protein ligase
MDKQRILKEAQGIASKYSFWMVSGNIEHLFGYVFENQGGKYELEIKFNEDFPYKPPNLIYHKEIKELLGDVRLGAEKNWSKNLSVLDLLHELKNKIQQALNEPKKVEDQSANSISKETIFPEEKMVEKSLAPNRNEVESIKKKPLEEEYVTPDLSAYPPDFDYEQFSNSLETQEDTYFEKGTNESKIENYEVKSDETTKLDTPQLTEPELFADHDQTSVALNTELGLIQQEYAYDQKSNQKGDLNIYLTITLAKTFIISINFTNYPSRPSVNLSDEVYKLIGDVNQSLEVLRTWNAKKPSHIVDVLHELETKLFFIKDIEQESKKILGEYQCELDSEDVTKLHVHLVTYGFKEYTMDVNLETYPKPPIINLSSQLQLIVSTPLTELKYYKDWVEGESEPVEIIREIAWLVDKNSRINFEIELLKEHYKKIEYIPSTSILNVDMKGKMKTQDLMFQFQIELPNDYPMKVPSIKIINEFELESHEKIKEDLQSSFKNFFDDWSPFSYLVDLFNAISKKIFEVSVVSCVICHKIDCPTCSLKIAGPEEETCHTDCPYCERSYHKHCWEQTIKSFGKCGFCLKTPPPSMMP